MNFGDLANVAFFVSRHLHPSYAQFVNAGIANAVGVRVDSLNYVEVGLEQR